MCSTLFIQSEKHRVLLPRFYNEHSIYVEFRSGVTFNSIFSNKACVYVCLCKMEDIYLAINCLGFSLIYIDYIVAPQGTIVWIWLDLTSLFRFLQGMLLGKIIFFFTFGLIWILKGFFLAVIKVTVSSPVLHYLRPISFRVSWAFLEFEDFPSQVLWCLNKVVCRCCYSLSVASAQHKFKTSYMYIIVFSVNIVDDIFSDLYV